MDWDIFSFLYLRHYHISFIEGYYNTNDDLTTNNILDKICKIYDSPLAEKTQSMRIEDINTALGLTLDKENNKLYKTADESKTPIQSYQSCFGQKYTYQLGDYAPENYLKEKYPSKYQSLTAKKANDTVDGTAFMVAYEDPSVVDPSSKLYDVLFKGTISSERDADENNNAKAYWLASSGAYIEGNSEVYADTPPSFYYGPGAVFYGFAGTGMAMFTSNGHSEEMALAIRPVVYLRSGVTVKDLTITENGTEQAWTTSIPNTSKENLEYGQIKN